MKLTREEFEEAVVVALKRLPKFIKEKMENVDVVVESRASREVLDEMGLCSSSELSCSELHFFSANFAAILIA